MKRPIALGLLAAVVAGVPARADLDADKATCAASATAPQSSAAACRRIIEANALTGRNLATIYNNLGVAELRLKRPEAAEKALSTALAIAPDDMSRIRCSSSGKTGAVRSAPHSAMPGIRTSEESSPPATITLATRMPRM